MVQAECKVGCCGFGMAQAEYYARFDLIEIQKTFYQPPRDATAERWRDEAPDDVEFTVKAWQLITHEPTSPTYRRLRTDLGDAEKKRVGGFRRSSVTMDAWERTRRIARLLRADKVLFQCPASFRPTWSRGRSIELSSRWRPRGVSAWSAPSRMCLTRRRTTLTRRRPPW